MKQLFVILANDGCIRYSQSPNPPDAVAVFAECADSRELDELNLYITANSDDALINNHFEFLAEN